MVSILLSCLHCVEVLFAIGLSLYLVELNLKVAVPVIITTIVAVIFYGATTLLPLVYNACPYITTLSKPLRTPSSWARKKLHDCFFSAWMSVYTPGWMADALWYVKNLLDIEQSQASETTPNELEEVSMDEITSQALGWLVSHCEDPKSTDIALQALAGAEYPLPRAPLVKCNAIELVWQRLESCFYNDPTNHVRPVLKNQSLLAPAVRYTRALTYLMATHSEGGPNWDTWVSNEKGAGWSGIRLGSLVLIYQRQVH